MVRYHSRNIRINFVITLSFAIRMVKRIKRFTEYIVVICIMYSIVFYSDSRCVFTGSNMMKKEV